MIIYSKSSEGNDTAYGKINTPIKMIIQHQSELLASQSGTRSALFNVEKSDRFGETIVATSDFDIFTATPEGEGATRDSSCEAYTKFIEHIQFTKEFAVTAEMIEDAQSGLAVDAKRRAENFTRAYYKTMNRICETALANGTEYSTAFSTTEIDLTGPDSLPLFNDNHIWGNPDGRVGNQSNYFWGDLLSAGSDGSRTLSAAAFEESLYELSIKLRNMIDDNGEPLGFSADTIIIPGNRPALESIVRKVCATPQTLGSSYNDVNLNYGNWRVVVMPSWQTTDNRFMIMSSEANKVLSGNMFFNRIPLTVTSWVDNHTGNYIWNGRCRFGVGFGSYKHILLAVDSATAVSGATKL